MSELNELKVGDVVSIFDEMSESWSCVQMASDYACKQLTGIPQDVKWQKGIHPSLIPEGYAIVPIEPTDEMLYEGQLYKKHILNYYKLDTREIYKAMLKASSSLIKK